MQILDYSQIEGRNGRGPRSIETQSLKDRKGTQESAKTRVESGHKNEIRKINRIAALARQGGR